MFIDDREESEKIVRIRKKIKDMEKEMKKREKFIMMKLSE